jgi:hypothetical protein
MNNLKDQPSGPGQCQHEACMCEAPEGSDYCSDACQNAASGDVGQGCPCGHASCAE